MTHAPWSSWEPQAPSDDFADRAAAAVLRDRTRRPDADRARARGGLRRTVLLAAAACVLLGGAAWAWTSYPGRGPSRDPSASPIAAVHRADPTPSLMPRSVVAAEVPPPPARAPSPLPVRPRPAPSPAPSAIPSVGAVPAPQCVCNAFACDCGPE